MRSGRNADNKLFKLPGYNDGEGRKVRERKQWHLGFAAYIRRGFSDVFPGAAVLNYSNEYIVIGYDAAAIR